MVLRISGEHTFFPGNHEISDLSKQADSLSSFKLVLEVSHYKFTCIKKWNVLIIQTELDELVSLIVLLIQPDLPANVYPKCSISYTYDSAGHKTSTKGVSRLGN